MEQSTANVVAYEKLIFTVYHSSEFRIYPFERIKNKIEHFNRKVKIVQAYNPLKNQIIENLTTK